jgi:hypothetical protein
MTSFFHLMAMMKSIIIMGEDEDGAIAAMNIDDKSRFLWLRGSIIKTKLPNRRPQDARRPPVNPPVSFPFLPFDPGQGLSFPQKMFNDDHSPFAAPNNTTCSDAFYDDLFHSDNGES